MVGAFGLNLAYEKILGICESVFVERVMQYRCANKPDRASSALIVEATACVDGPRYGDQLSTSRHAQDLDPLLKWRCG